MLELLRENEVAERFRVQRLSANDAMIAVPFWGSGSIKALGLENPIRTRVVCNLESGACNPSVIRQLSALGHKVRTRSDLHAKIYATPNAIIIGSSNASSNGLAITRTESPGMIEANIFTDEIAIVKSTLKLFKEIWDGSVAISDVMFQRAEVAWNNRPRPAVGLIAKSLLAACRERPDLFDSVFVAAYSEDLGTGGKAAVTRLQERAAKSAKDDDARNFQNAWGYQYEQKIPDGSWIVDLDCRNAKRPKIYGCARVPDPAYVVEIEDEDSLLIALRGVVTIANKRLPIPREEKKALLHKAPEILKRADGIFLPLAEAIAIIDE